MASRSPLLRIHDMLESIRGIEKALAGKTMRDYERSWLLRSAVERGIEVISEASRHLGRDLKAQHKDVRWKDIAGIGNILRHDYQRVDASIIWRAVKNDLPAQGCLARAKGFAGIATMCGAAGIVGSTPGCRSLNTYAGVIPDQIEDARPRIANSIRPGPRSVNADGLQLVAPG